jgi:predicted porin
VFWGGVKWPVTPDLDLMAAYYGYKQNSYATGKDAGCTSNVAGSCSGTENAFSLVGDYKFSKRFDAYIGTFWSSVNDGLANGYLQTSNLTSTMGVRFRF